MAKSIEQEIADLEKAINSPATPEAQKGVMKGILEKLKAKQSSAPTKSNEPKDLSTQKGRNEYVEKMSKAPAKKSEMIPKNFDEKIDEYLSKKYPNYKDEKLGEIDDDEYNDIFFEMVDDLRENFDEFNDEKGGDEAMANDYVEDYMSSPPKKKAVPKAEPKTETKKPTSEDDYDCDTLIEKEKTRRAKIKERALKKANAPKPTQATKNRDAIEKVGDKLEASIEKRLETGKVSKNELTKLIEETKALLKMLESYLDKVN